jgi:hypothetical protein
MAKMQHHVHIGHHYFGAGNMGDDLTLEGFSESLGARRDDFVFTCCIPHRIETQIKRFPWIKWLPLTPEARINAIRSADSWLGLGGTPFQTDSGMYMVEHLSQELHFCDVENKPMYFLGVGVNNLEATEVPAIQRVVNSANHIWTRDEASAKMLRAISHQANVTKGADLANCYLSHYSTQGLSKALGICLNFESSDLFNVRAIEALCDFTDGEWLAQDDRIFNWNERTLWNSISSKVTDRWKLRICDYSAPSVARLFADWPPLGSLITSRYHAALYYAWCGASIALVNRNAKLRALADDLGLPSVDRICDAGDVASLLNAQVVVDRGLLLKLSELADTAVSAWIAATERIAK